MSKKLQSNDYAAAASILGVDVPSIKAVTAIESRGSGFLPDGRPVILYERHIMYRRLKDKRGQAFADQLAHSHPDVVNPKAGGYGPTSMQHDRLAQAARIDRDCALESASWGLFQIMGFHWKALQYEDLQTFINRMYESEAQHLNAFVRFIRLDRDLWQCLKSKDWAGFARRFNGPNYAINDYDTKLAKAYLEAGGAV